MRVKAKTARIDLLLSEYDKVTPKNGKYTADMLSAKLSFEKRFLALT